MNIYTLEWHFGDARQMLCGSTNKLVAMGVYRADVKANTFNTAKCRITGNNATGDNHSGRAKQHREEFHSRFTEYVIH